MEIINNIKESVFGFGRGVRHVLFKVSLIVFTGSPNGVKIEDGYLSDDSNGTIPDPWEI